MKSEEYTRHPLTDVTIESWESVTAPPHIRWVSMFLPVGKYPIYFSGHTYEESHSRAESFRQKAIKENEETYVKRVKALEKAREYRTRKGSKNDKV